jgi:dTDP-4-dehydrorhamnose 3,5-epimerase
VEFRKGRLDGIYHIGERPFSDHRGFQTKPFNAETFEVQGFNFNWKQVILSHSTQKNTLRGLYIQKPPMTEGKLVACSRGAFFWVVVDLRTGSKTFGEWEGVHLKEDDGETLLIMPGFAHGCLSLTDHGDLLLLGDNHHSDAHGVSIAWNDPDLAIEWPLLGPQPIISLGHAGAPSFKDFCRTVGSVKIDP